MADSAAKRADDELRKRPGAVGAERSDQESGSRSRTGNTVPEYWRRTRKPRKVLHWPFRMSLHRLLWVAALIVLSAQVLLACSAALVRGDSLSGDEGYYLRKADHVLRHGTFPAQAEAKTFTDGTWASWGDVRPPGYPLVLAKLGIGSESNRQARLKVAAVQSGLTALGLAFVALLLRPVFDNALPPALFALVLAIQPWSFAFSPSYLPDPLSAALVLAGSLASAAGSIGESWWNGLGRLALGTLLLGCATFFRVEDLLFGGLVTATCVGIAGAVGGWRSLWRAAVLTAACWGGVAGLHAAYWKHSVGTWQVVRMPGPRPAPGLYSWLQTFIHPESSFTTTYWSALRGDSRLGLIPPRAYFNRDEKDRITAAFALIAEEGRLSGEADRVFEAVSTERRARSWFKAVALPASARSIQLWAHRHTNSQLLGVLTGVRSPLRRALLGALFVMKLAVLAMAGLAVGLSAFQFFAAPTRRSFWTATVLCCGVFVASKTVYVGVVVGLPEHRYMLGGWSLVLVMAGAGLAQLAGRKGPMAGSAYLTRNRRGAAEA